MATTNNTQRGDIHDSHTYRDQRRHLGKPQTARVLATVEAFLSDIRHHVVAPQPVFDLVLSFYALPVSIRYKTQTTHFLCCPITDSWQSMGLKRVICVAFGIWLGAALSFTRRGQRIRLWKPHTWQETDIFDVAEDTNAKITHFLKKLKQKANDILESNLFWNQLGFENKDLFVAPQMKSLIQKHPLFTMTVLRRLVEELQMYEFVEEYWKHWTRGQGIENDKWITNYRLKRHKPLEISETIRVKPLGEKYIHNGMIHMDCNTEIIINKGAQINANECGMSKHMSLFYKDKAQKKDKQIYLKFGRFDDSSLAEEVDSEHVGNGSGGGVIELISQSNIVNNGTLTSNATNADYFGGTVCIKTRKCFINNGQIFAKPHGQIIIKCNSFVNNGTIAPEPIVIKTSSDDGTAMDCTFGAVYPCLVAASLNLHKIKLTVYQHHGHDDEDETPEDLLDGSNTTRYCSAKGKTAGDWITFRMHELAYIRKIRIVNGVSDCGIRCIELFVGSDKVNSKWIKLCKDITNIKKDDWSKRSKSVQEFDIINSLSDYFMFKNQFNLLKIQILKNHGHSNYNIFYQFEVFGVEYK
eukprot:1153482_1